MFRVGPLKAVHSAALQSRDGVRAAMNRAARNKTTDAVVLAKANVGVDATGHGRRGEKRELTGKRSVNARRDDANARSVVELAVDAKHGVVRERLDRGVRDAECRARRHGTPRPAVCADFR